jgi:hypothetical protein
VAFTVSGIIGDTDCQRTRHFADDGPLVVIVSGGNISIERLKELL